MRWLESPPSSDAAAKGGNALWTGRVKVTDRLALFQRMEPDWEIRNGSPRGQSGPRLTWRRARTDKLLTAVGADSEPPDAASQPTSSHRKGVLNDADSRLYRLLTVGEVAALLNVPRKWVYRRVGLKPPEGIPYLKVGKYLRFRESDLREYVERLRRN